MIFVLRHTDIEVALVLSFVGHGPVCVGGCACSTVIVMLGTSSIGGS